MIKLDILLFTLKTRNESIIISLLFSNIWHQNSSRSHSHWASKSTKLEKSPLSTFAKVFSLNFERMFAKKWPNISLIQNMHTGKTMFRSDLIKKVWWFDHSLVRYQANTTIDHAPLKSVELGHTGRFLFSTLARTLGHIPSKSTVKSIIWGAGSL